MEAISLPMCKKTAFIKIHFRLNIYPKCYVFVTISLSTVLLPCEDMHVFFPLSTCGSYLFIFCGFAHMLCLSNRLLTIHTIAHIYTWKQGQASTIGRRERPLGQMLTQGHGKCRCWGAGRAHRAFLDHKFKIPSERTGPKLLTFIVLLYQYTIGPHHQLENHAVSIVGVIHVNKSWMGSKMQGENITLSHFI